MNFCGNLNQSLTNKAHKLEKLRGFVPGFLFAVTVLTRLPFTSRFLYHLDSVQYALGLAKYDVYLHQPQPPGYFLYVMAGKALNFLVNDPNRSFIWISLVSSGLAIVALYYLGSAIFSRPVGLSAAFLALTSPLFWLYGEVALNYDVAAFFNIWLALLCWQLLQKEYKWAYLSPIVLGLAAGVRPDFFIFLFPLWFLCVFKSVERKNAVFLLILLGVTLASWVIPMLIMTGGLARYLAAVHEHWEFHNSAFAIWNAGLASRKDVVLTLLGSMAYGLGIGMVFILFSIYAVIRTGRWRLLGGERGLFFGLWLVPAFLLQAFVVLHPYLHRYGLFFLPGLAILLPGSIEFALAEIERVAGSRYSISRINPTMLLWLVIGLNGAMFCLSKTAYSAHTIQEHDLNLKLLLSGLKANFQSENTVVVDAKSSFFYSYRHVQYYLPQFRTYLTDRRINKQGQKWHIFGTVNGKTRLYDALHLPANTLTIVYLVDPRDEKFGAELTAMHMRQILMGNHVVLYYQLLLRNR